MNTQQLYRLAKKMRKVSVTCDRILSILEEMRERETDSLIESLRQSAREMYLCSLEERRRTGNILSISKHD